MNSKKNRLALLIEKKLINKDDREKSTGKGGMVKKVDLNSKDISSEIKRASASMLNKLADQDASCFSGDQFKSSVIGLTSKKVRSGSGEKKNRSRSVGIRNNRPSSMIKISNYNSESTKGGGCNNKKESKKGPQKHGRKLTIDWKGDSKFITDINFFSKNNSKEDLGLGGLVSGKSCFSKIKSRLIFSSSKKCERSPKRNHGADKGIGAQSHFKDTPVGNNFCLEKSSGGKFLKQKKWKLDFDGLNTMTAGQIGKKQNSKSILAKSETNTSGRIDPCFKNKLCQDQLNSAKSSKMLENFSAFKKNKNRKMATTTREKPVSLYGPELCKSNTNFMSKFDSANFLSPCVTNLSEADFLQSCERVAGLKSDKKYTMANRARNSVNNDIFSKKKDPILIEDKITKKLNKLPNTVKKNYLKSGKKSMDGYVGTGIDTHLKGKTTKNVFMENFSATAGSGFGGTYGPEKSQALQSRHDYFKNMNIEGVKKTDVVQSRFARKVFDGGLEIGTKQQGKGKLFGGTDKKPETEKPNNKMHEVKKDEPGIMKDNKTRSKSQGKSTKKKCLKKVKSGRVLSELPPDIIQTKTPAKSVTVKLEEIVEQKSPKIVINVDSSADFQNNFEKNLKNICATQIQRAWALHVLKKNNKDNSLKANQRHTSITQVLQQPKKVFRDNTIAPMVPKKKLADTPQKKVLEATKNADDVYNDLFNRENIQYSRKKCDMLVDMGNSNKVINRDRNQLEEQQYPKSDFSINNLEGVYLNTQTDQTNEQFEKNSSRKFSNNIMNAGKPGPVSRKVDYDMKETPGNQIKPSSKHLKIDFINKYTIFVAKQIKKWEKVISKIKDIDSGTIKNENENQDDLLDSLEKKGALNEKILGQMSKIQSSQKSKKDVLFNNTILKRLKARDTQIKPTKQDISKKKENSQQNEDFYIHDLNEDYNEPTSAKNHFSHIPPITISNHNNNMICPPNPPNTNKNIINIYVDVSKHIQETQQQDKKSTPSDKITVESKNVYYSEANLQTPPAKANGDVEVFIENKKKRRESTDNQYTSEVRYTSQSKVLHSNYMSSYESVNLKSDVPSKISDLKSSEGNYNYLGGMLGSYPTCESKVYGGGLLDYNFERDQAIGDKVEAMKLGLVATKGSSDIFVSKITKVKTPDDFIGDEAYSEYSKEISNEKDEEISSNELIFEAVHKKNTNRNGSKEIATCTNSVKTNESEMIAQAKMNLMFNKMDTKFKKGQMKNYKGHVEVFKKKMNNVDQHFKKKLPKVVNSQIIEAGEKKGKKKNGEFVIDHMEYVKNIVQKELLKKDKKLMDNLREAGEELAKDETDRKKEIVNPQLFLKNESESVESIQHKKSSQKNETGPQKPPNFQKEAFGICEKLNQVSLDSEQQEVSLPMKSCCLPAKVDSQINFKKEFQRASQMNLENNLINSKEDKWVDIDPTMNEKTKYFLVSSSVYPNMSYKTDQFLVTKSKGLVSPKGGTNLSIAGEILDNFFGKDVPVQDKPKTKSLENSLVYKNFKRQDTDKLNRLNLVKSQYINKRRMTNLENHTSYDNIGSGVQSQQKNERSSKENIKSLLDFYYKNIENNCQRNSELFSETKKPNNPLTTNQTDNTNNRKTDAINSAGRQFQFPTDVKLSNEMLANNTGLEFSNRLSLNKSEIQINNVQAHDMSLESDATNSKQFFRKKEHSEGVLIGYDTSEPVTPNKLEDSPLDGVLEKVDCQLDKQKGLSVSYMKIESACTKIQNKESKINFIRDRERNNGIVNYDNSNNLLEDKFLHHDLNLNNKFAKEILGTRDEDGFKQADMANLDRFVGRDKNLGVIVAVDQIAEKKNLEKDLFKLIYQSGNNVGYGDRPRDKLLKDHKEAQNPLEQELFNIENHDENNQNHEDFYQKKPNPRHIDIIHINKIDCEKNDQNEQLLWDELNWEDIRNSETGSSEIIAEAQNILECDYLSRLAVSIPNSPESEDQQLSTQQCNEDFIDHELLIGDIRKFDKLDNDKTPLENTLPQIQPKENQIVTQKNIDASMEYIQKVNNVDVITNDVVDYLVKEMLEDDEFLNCLVKKEPKPETRGILMINKDIENYLNILVKELKSNSILIKIPQVNTSH